MHAAAVHADDRLRQEAGGQAHLGRDLAADQLVELDLVGGRHNIGVAVVDLELRGRNLRVVLLVLEAHGALHFRGCVDELAKRIAGQRVIVAAGVHVFELAGVVIAPLRVRSLEEKAFNFVRGVQRVPSSCSVVGVVLQHAANVARSKANRPYR